MWGEKKQLCLFKCPFLESASTEEWGYRFLLKETKWASDGYQTQSLTKQTLKSTVHTRRKTSEGSISRNKIEERCYILHLRVWCRRWGCWQDGDTLLRWSYTDVIRPVPTVAQTGTEIRPRLLISHYIYRGQYQP